MPVIYNGEILVPAPLVSIQKDSVRGPDRRILRHEYQIQLTGTIVNTDTDLDSGDAFDYPEMEGILAEQRRMRSIFSEDGKRLEITSPPAGGPNTIDLYCTVESIGFSPGVWVQRCDYTITLKSHTILVDQEEDLSELESFSENWNITENEDSTYSLTHSLSAQGALIFTELGANDPLGAARTYINARRYDNSSGGAFGPATGSGTLDLSTLLIGLPSITDNYWNKAVVESADPSNYSWNLTETFIQNPSGNFREEWTASVNYENDNPNKATINVAGAVIGFAENNKDRSIKLANASGAFETVTKPNLYTRLLPYKPAEFTLIATPSSRQYSYESEGVVRYSYGYIANNGSLIPNAIDESVNISDVNPTDIFAQIQVPGRANGPVVQNMHTVTLPERTVNISATIAASGQISTSTSLLAAYLAKPNTNDLIAELRPSAGYYYIKQDTEEWNPIKRQYGRSVSWVIQTEGSAVDGQDPANRNNAP